MFGVWVAEIMDFSDDYVVPTFTSVGQEFWTWGDVMVLLDLEIGESLNVEMFEPGSERMILEEVVNVGCDGGVRCASC